MILTLLPRIMGEDKRATSRAEVRWMTQALWGSAGLLRLLLTIRQGFQTAPDCICLQVTQTTERNCVRGDSRRMEHHSGSNCSCLIFWLKWTLYLWTKVWPSLTTEKGGRLSLPAFSVSSALLMWASNLTCSSLVFEEILARANSKC